MHQVVCRRAPVTSYSNRPPGLMGCFSASHAGCFIRSIHGPAIEAGSHSSSPVAHSLVHVHVDGPVASTPMLPRLALRGRRRAPAPLRPLLRRRRGAGRLPGLPFLFAFRSLLLLPWLQLHCPHVHSLRLVALPLARPGSDHIAGYCRCWSRPLSLWKALPQSRQTQGFLFLPWPPFPFFPPPVLFGGGPLGSAGRLVSLAPAGFATTISFRCWRLLRLLLVGGGLVAATQADARPGHRRGAGGGGGAGAGSGRPSSTKPSRPSELLRLRLSFFSFFSFLCLSFLSFFLSCSDTSPRRVAMSTCRGARTPIYIYIYYIYVCLI